MPSVFRRLAPAAVDPDRLAVRLEDASPLSLLLEFHKDIQCIGTVTPPVFAEGWNETTKVVITGNMGGACKNGPRKVDLWMTFSNALGMVFVGALNVSYEPQKSAWIGTIRREGYGNANLCTDPKGFDKGVDLSEDELIKLYICG